MNIDDKPPPYSPEAPPQTTQPISTGYQVGAGGFAGVPPPNPNTYGAIPPGYQVVHPSNLPAYGSTVYVQQPPPVSPQIVLVGGCPACRVGVLEEDFTCCGVCMAILFFPLGILCCLAMRQRRCANCGAVFH